MKQKVSFLEQRGKGERDQEEDQAAKGSGHGRLESNDNDFVHFTLSKTGSN